jgi:sugar-specific transcriptional regulator TrmB
MEQKQLTECLIEYGLTRQEANVYIALYKCGTMTGYEAAKETGISRSNAYNALASLVDKGAAYVMEGAATKYVPVEIGEFCENKIRIWQSYGRYLKENMPKEKTVSEGYLTIETDAHILNKMKNMLLRTKMRVYLSISAALLPRIEEELRALIQNGKKLVILTDAPVDFPGATVYETEDKHNQIGMITDSEFVLTGQFGLGRESTCLYSDQKNFVQVFKQSMSNEIKLLEIKRGE